mgnify:CR=1 FL=1
MAAHLQQAVDLLKKRLLALGALVEDMVLRSVKALKDRDCDLAREVIETDTRVDMMDVDIEEECQKIGRAHV